ncbi:MAG TPA: hypothetical protein DDX72_02975 [Ruminococcaceae bacterium]|nr:hypothetical protein [Oscillospiraceae bacterium]
MSKEKLFNGITNIDDDLIEASQQQYEQRKSPMRFMPWIAGAAAVCVCAAAAGVFMLNSGAPEVGTDTGETSNISTSVTEEALQQTTPSSEFTYSPLTVTEESVTTAPPGTETSESPEVTTETIPEPDTVITEITQYTETAVISSDPVTETSPDPTEISSAESTETVPPETVVTTSETTIVTERKIPQTSVNDLTYLSAPDDAASVLAEPVYPYFPPYPDESVYTDYDKFEEVYDAWSKAKNELHNQHAGYKKGTEPFFRNSIRTFLGEASDKNKVYSPLSLFMALGMSAEISGGYTRQQFLDVLGQESIEDLRARAKAIWQANYSDDGAAKCILASSVWLNSGISYAQETVDNISDFYYSSVFSGVPGTEEYDKLLQDWLNTQTDGMLDEYASGVKLEPTTVIALASTVNYSGKWRDHFSKDNTKMRSFQTPNGYIGCDFMNTERGMMAYGGSKFTAVSLKLEENGYMRLILPDSGYTAEDLIDDEETISFLLRDRLDTFENKKYLTVALSVPKFDVSQQFDLTKGMKALGITDAFDVSASDFEPLTDTAIDISIGSATQASRVTIDETGCKAASFTLISYDGDIGLEDLDRIELVFDKPFIFEIMSETGLPLFVGIVNDPTG